jgi:hypothetical protein
MFDDLTIVARFDTFRSAWNHVITFQTACQNLSQLVLIGPEYLVSDLSVSSKELQKVTFVSEAITDSDLHKLIDTTFTLILPKSEPSLIVGIGAAIELLNVNPNFTAVGGLVFSKRGSVTSSAFSIVHEVSRGLIASCPIEALEPVWEKHGAFAVTPADFLGGVVLCRSENANFAHLGDFSEIAKAFSVLPISRKTYPVVFSGLVLVCADQQNASASNSGRPESLPDSTYRLWNDASIKEISVLNSGRVSRIAGLEKVVFYPDRRKPSVDGKGTRPPFNPCLYYRSESHTRQLGPGFDPLFSLVMTGDTSRLHENRQVELSELEFSLVQRFRHLGKSLPSSWVSKLRKILGFIIRARV